MKIKKGDNVQIITGKDRGKRGEVLKLDVKARRVLVKGLNVYKKHQRPKQQGQKGEVINVSRFLDASNTLLVCSSCDKPVRTGYRVEEDKKIRYCKKCKSAI